MFSFQKALAEVYTQNFVIIWFSSLKGLRKIFFMGGERLYHFLYRFSDRRIQNFDSQKTRKSSSSSPPPPHPRFFFSFLIFLRKKKKTWHIFRLELELQTFSLRQNWVWSFGLKFLSWLDPNDTTVFFCRICFCCWNYKKFFSWRIARNLK